MADNYDELIKLIYPSIQASGNVYYGQTKKLITDSYFDKNSFYQFSSRLNYVYEHNGLKYSCFTWKFGPLSGSYNVPVNPNVFIDNFCEKKNGQTDNNKFRFYIKYKVIHNQETVGVELNSGSFSEPRFYIKLELENFLDLVSTKIKDGWYYDDSKPGDIDDHIVVVKEGTDNYLYVKLLDKDLNYNVTSCDQINEKKPLFIKYTDTYYKSDLVTSFGNEPIINESNLYKYPLSLEKYVDKDKVIKVFDYNEDQTHRSFPNSISQDIYGYKNFKDNVSFSSGANFNYGSLHTTTLPSSLLNDTDYIENYHGFQITTSQNQGQVDYEHLLRDGFVPASSFITTSWYSNNNNNKYRTIIGVTKDYNNTTEDIDYPDINDLRKHYVSTNGRNITNCDFFNKGSFFVSEPSVVSLLSGSYRTKDSHNIITENLSNFSVVPFSNIFVIKTSVYTDTSSSEKTNTFDGYKFDKDGFKVFTTRNLNSIEDYTSITSTKLSTFSIESHSIESHSIESQEILVSDLSVNTISSRGLGDPIYLNCSSLEPSSDENITIGTEDNPFMDIYCTSICSNNLVSIDGNENIRCCNSLEPDNIGVSIGLRVNPFNEIYTKKLTSYVKDYNGYSFKNSISYYISNEYTGLSILTNREDELEIPNIICTSDSTILVKHILPHSNDGVSIGSDNKYFKSVYTNELNINKYTFSVTDKLPTKEGYYLFNNVTIEGNKLFQDLGTYFTDEVEVLEYYFDNDSYDLIGKLKTEKYDTKQLVYIKTRNYSALLNSHTSFNEMIKEGYDYILLNTTSQIFLINFNYPVDLVDQTCDVSSTLGGYISGDFYIRYKGTDNNTHNFNLKSSNIKIFRCINSICILQYVESNNKTTLFILKKPQETQSDYYLETVKMIILDNHPELHLPFFDEPDRKFNYIQFYKRIYQIEDNIFIIVYQYPVNNKTFHRATCFKVKEDGSIEYLGHLPFSGGTSELFSYIDKMSFNIEKYLKVFITHENFIDSRIDNPDVSVTVNDGLYHVKSKNFISKVN